MSGFVRKLIVLIVIMAFAIANSGCAASSNCCNCIKNNYCIIEDKGACNSHDPCEAVKPEESYNDDNESNPIDAIIGIIYLTCLAFSERTMKVNYDCERKKKCTVKCKDDKNHITYIKS